MKSSTCFEHWFSLTEVHFIGLYYTVELILMIFKPLFAIVSLEVTVSLGIFCFLYAQFIKPLLK